MATMMEMTKEIKILDPTIIDEVEGLLVGIPLAEELPVPLLPAEDMGEVMETVHLQSLAMERTRVFIRAGKIHR